MQLRARLLLALLPTSLLLSGCLGDVMEIFCEAGPDSDHCYQAAAVQESEPDDCANVKGEGFTGQNPPKDKCFLQIAENTGDPTVCDGIVGGITSYTQEECLDAVYRNHTVDACKDAKDPQKCRDAYGKKFGECGDGFIFNKESQICDVRKPPAEGSDDGIENKAEDELKTMGDAAKGKYMDLLTDAIENETDPSKLEGLQKYKEFLEKAGETMETVELTVDKLKEIKKIFLDAYDPSMDIDRMPVDKILAKGLTDRIKDRLFGEDPPSERGRADDALSVYEAMLKRQGDIDFLKKGRLDRLTDTVASGAKDQATEKLKETAEGIAEGVAGTAFVAVGVVDKAISSFQEAAQKEMFTGLAAAYNRQRDSIAQANPGLSPDEIHKRTVAQVKDDPYQDVPNSGFVKYGNILENPDCQTGGNPLCIDDRVFWTAMGKAYEYGKKR